VSISPLARLVALCLTPGIGGVTLRALFEHFGDIDAVWGATPEALCSVPGIGPRTAAAIRAADPARTSAEIARWEASGLTLLTWTHPHYPAALYKLHDAPPLLFCRGRLRPEDAQAVAIVGTRKPSPRGRALAETLGHELGARGWTVISGLAWGVDVAAHSGALRTGRTIAVLGGGLNLAQPGKKAALVSRIEAQGALLSELHPQTVPAASGLVARNRIISGLSQAVIVVEAEADSGSLYTARFAARQARTVFAVDNGLSGNASLLAGGAHPIPPDFADWDGLHTRLSAPPPETTPQPGLA
jgi:DNA processing protein